MLFEVETEAMLVEFVDLSGVHERRREDEQEKWEPGNSKMDHFTLWPHYIKYSLIGIHYII